MILLKKISAFISLVLLVSLFAGCSSVKEPTVTVEDKAYYEKYKDQKISINVYNWGEYIANGTEYGMLDVNAEFEALTGIKVNYTTYSTNEELYAKLKGGAGDYDIIIPSDYMVSRMIKEDMLSPLDYSLIPNSKNIMESFKNAAYDEGDVYSVPYMWGTVGIVYDKEVIKEKDIDWDILWNEKYKDQLLMFDNPRDAFALAELSLGYSLNTEDPDELKAAAEKLKEQKPLVQAYVMDEIFDKMGAGEALLAPYYAGDAVTMMQDYDHLGFAIPKSGTNRFVDAVCIPKTSGNKEAAHMYINFLLEAEVALANSEYIGYSTPNKKAFDILPDEIKNDGISYLDDEYLNTKTTVFKNLSDDANKLMQDLWIDIKTAD